MTRSDDLTRVVGHSTAVRGLPVHAGAESQSSDIRAAGCALCPITCVDPGKSGVSLNSPRAENFRQGLRGVDAVDIGLDSDSNSLRNDYNNGELIIGDVHSSRVCCGESVSFPGGHHREVGEISSDETNQGRKMQFRKSFSFVELSPGFWTSTAAQLTFCTMSFILYGVLITLVFLLITSAKMRPALQIPTIEDFDTYARTFGKTYPSADEAVSRFENFKQNLMKIRTQNITGSHFFI